MPTVPSVLSVLSAGRLVDLFRLLGCDVRDITRTIRDLAPRFDNRLFLSATVQLALSNVAGAWRLAQTSYDAESGEEGPAITSDLAAGQPRGLLLGEKLQRYTELCAPTSGQGRLPFIQLQQRLLSSPEAFARTTEAHAQGGRARGCNRGRGCSCGHVAPGAAESRDVGRTIRAGPFHTFHRAISATRPPFSDCNARRGCSILPA